jgi:hypothetical protein
VDDGSGASTGGLAIEVAGGEASWAGAALAEASIPTWAGGGEADGVDGWA